MNFALVRLSYRDKQSLYHSLSQLIRSGISFSSALQKLERTSGGPLRRVVHALHTCAANGQTVAECFATQRNALGLMEASVVGAAERSGRLDHGLEQLATYFEALARARETLIRQAAYPVFVLHFAILVLAAPTVFTKGLPAYVREVGTSLFIVYLAVVAFGVLIRILQDAGTTNASVDRFLRAVPGIGRIRRSFALSRFNLIYEVQLDAGLNVLEALPAAAVASQSGMVRHAVECSLPELRAGGQVGPLLAVSGAFPESMMRAFMVGEETGGLDRELQRLAIEFQRDALARLESFAQWSAKLLYVGLLLYLAWRIIAGYSNYLKQVMEVGTQ